MTWVKVRREILRDAWVLTKAKALSLASLNRPLANRRRPYARMDSTLYFPSTTASTAYFSAMGEATLQSLEQSKKKTESTMHSLMKGRSEGQRKGSIS